MNEHPILRREADPGYRVAQWVETAAELVSLDGYDLDRLLVAHEAEIVKLKGFLAAAHPTPRPGMAQALRLLHLHAAWATREISVRRKAAKHEAQRFADLRAAAVREDKHARLALSRGQDRKDIEIFKAVCLEVVGSEVYQHLWEMTKVRIAATTTGEF